MTTEKLDWDVPSDDPDCLENGVGLFRTNGDMSSHQEEVDIGAPNGLLEPFFLDGFFYWLDDGVVVVHGKIEDETKRNNADSLFFRGEFLVPRSHGNNILSRRMDNIDIRR